MFALFHLQQCFSTTPNFSNGWRSCLVWERSGV